MSRRHPLELPLATALLVAAATRFAYLGEHMTSPFFGIAILDEAWYDGMARALLGGGGAPDASFRPLLYPLFLAAAYRLGGPYDTLAAVGLQHLLGLATTALVVLIAARLFRRPWAGGAAGLLYALAGPPLYFEGERLLTTLFTFLATLLLWLLARAEAATRPRWWWLAAGGCWGLAALARPNVLILLPAFFWAAWRRRRRGAAAGEATAAVVMPLAAALLVLAAAAALQAPYAGGFQLLGGAGGVNLYLGNQRGADGMTPRQDRYAPYSHQYADTVQLFAEEEYRLARRRPGDRPAERPPAGAVNRYWLGRTLDEIRAAPAAWAALMGRKTLLLLHHGEIPNNKSYSFVLAEESALLRRLPVRWWLLLALAPLGVMSARRGGDRAVLRWVLAFAVLYGLSIVAFFVNGRFRIPLWPALAVLAGGGLLHLLAGLRSGWPRGLLRPALASAVAALSLVDWVGAREPGWGRDHFFRSIAALEKGDEALALTEARRSLALDPDDPAAWFQLGLVEQRRGRPDRAYGAYRRAAVMRPQDPKSFNNLGVVLEELGRPAAAHACYRRSLAAMPSYGPALVNAALLEQRAELTEIAAARLAAAAAAGFDSPSMRFALAEAARARGDESAAAALAALARDEPQLVAALAAERQRPLDGSLGQVRCPAP